MSTPRVRSIVAAGILTVALASPAHSKTFVEILIGEGDEATGIALGLYEQEESGGIISMGEDQAASEHDLGIAGGDGVLTFSGSGSASAEIQRLRATAAASVTNAFFDPEFDDSEGTGHVPTYYFSQTTAGFSETLQYGGTAVAYSSRYFFRLTGFNSGVGAHTLVTLTHAMLAPQDFFFFEPGAYDQIISSEAFVHGLSPQEFTLKMLTRVSYEMEFEAEGSDVAGVSDFGSTLEFIGIELRDQDGNLAPAGTITSESGATYSIVPEPTTSLLLGLAACGLGALRRRRR